MNGPFIVHSLKIVGFCEVPYRYRGIGVGGGHWDPSGRSDPDLDEGPGPSCVTKLSQRPTTFFFFGRQLEFLPTSKAHYVFQPTTDKRKHG